MLQKYIKKFLHKPNQDKKSCNSFYLADELFFQSNNISAEEYSNNVIVHRCVNIISQAASHIPWVIYEKRGHSKPFKLSDHPIYLLLRRPNSSQAGADFFSELVATKLLYGNAYIFASGEKAPNNLFLLHPKNMNIIQNNGHITHYIYKNQDKEIKFPVNHKNSSCKILHIKNYNPASSTRGIAAIKPAAKAIELHNNTSNWNNNLLKNGARPTGALVMKDANNYLTEEQFQRLQEQLYHKFSGSDNSGKPLLLEGGLDWKEIGVSPKDMDFIESKNSAAREIALAFGLPPQLLGISGDNTYSNMQEARIALWEETIIPLLDKIADNLSNWLSIWFGKEIIIDFERESISALSEKRYSLIEKISNANFMTLNENRAILGLYPIKGGDEILR